jgi:large subunit ribosomal protein L15
MDPRQATSRLYTSISRKSSLPSLSTHVKTRPSRTFAQSRNFSSACSALQVNLKPPETPIEDTPRWKQTPKGLKWPFQTRQRKNPEGVWVCNDDPRLLHDMYDRLIGNHNLLSEETRWLAITHKSFDQGKRGYNDRLSYFGIYLDSRNERKTTANEFQQAKEYSSSKLL